MYEKVQKRSSDWSSTSAQRSSQSQYGQSSFSVQRQSNKKSNPLQQKPEYSTAARDAFAAKIMRTLEAEGLREEAAPKQISELAINDEAPATTEAGAIQRQQESGNSGEVMIPIQAKLTIGEPGDEYEQEADRVAEQLMRMPDSELLNQAFTVERQATGSANPMSISRQKLPGAFEVQPIQEGLQRKCVACEEDEQAVQMKPSLQRIAADGSSQAISDIESQLSRSKGGGSPLSEEVRSFMEPRIGAGFSRVRVHTDNSALQMNQELSAQAFTHGSDIYFGAGKYNPGSSDGKQLLAHELTHVVQQTGGVQTQLTQDNPSVHREGLAYEQEEGMLQQLLSVSSSPEVLQRRTVCDENGEGCYEVDDNQTPANQQNYTPADQNQTPANQQNYTPADQNQTPADQSPNQIPIDQSRTTAGTGEGTGLVLASIGVAIPFPVAGGGAATTTGVSVAAVPLTAVLAFFAVLLFPNRSIMTEEGERNLLEQSKYREKARTQEITVSDTANPSPPPPNLCNKAIKVLEQYERLAKKLGKTIPPKRLAELDKKRMAGTITSDDLPGFLEFPGGVLEKMTLEAIRQLCGKSKD